MRCLVSNMQTCCCLLENLWAYPWIKTSHIYINITQPLTSKVSNVYYHHCKLQLTCSPDSPRKDVLLPNLIWWNADFQSCFEEYFTVVPDSAFSLESVPEIVRCVCVWWCLWLLLYVDAETGVGSRGSIWRPPCGGQQLAIRGGPGSGSSLQHKHTNYSFHFIKLKLIKFMHTK